MINSVLVMPIINNAFSYGKVELHIKNKTTAEIDYRFNKEIPQEQKSIVVNVKEIITYDNFRFTIKKFYDDVIQANEGSYDFNNNVSNDHSLLAHVGNSPTMGRLITLQFYDSTTMPISYVCYI
jgi:hypothetical protein